MQFAVLVVHMRLFRYHSNITEIFCALRILVSNNTAEECVILSYNDVCLNKADIVLDTIINVPRPPYKVPVILVRF
jgi:hypothetical protein